MTAPAPPAPTGPPGSPGPSSRRGLVLVAVLLTLVLAVALVVFVTRPTTTPAPRPSAGAETSAGVLLGWGEPNYSQEFEGPLGPEWRLYDGPGHVGNGVRSPGAITVDDGLLTITGDSEGTTGGMALFPGQMHGRWEARVRAPVGDESYHALLLLWPDAENWPVGGEVDFMEMLDPARQKTEIFVHYGPDNSQVQGEVLADGTQWQNWAVEWSPEHIIAYLNGNEWYRTSDPEVFPPGPMHLAIQLDWFPENGVGEVQETQMQVDWVKQYSW